MKYCSKCGNELMDEAVVCTSCGCSTELYGQKPTNNESSNSGLKTAAKVFMIISCVGWAFLLIPLLWVVPMTIEYCNKIKNGEQVSVGFKICTLLFVDLIAGILMLCDTK